MDTNDPLFAPMTGVEHQELGGVKLEVAHVGNARIKRSIYPVGFRWSKNVKPIIGGDYCMHTHVGMLVHGRIHMEFPDGCVKEFKAPQVVVIEPGHDGWVEGDEPAVLVEFDYEGDTARRLGLPEQHSHG